MLTQANGLLWADMGMGKTSLTYKYLKHLLAAEQLERVLIISPLRPAQLVWPAEQEKWAGFEDLDVCLLHGTKKDQILAEGHRICIINPDGIEWLFHIEEERRMVMTKDVVTGGMKEKEKVFLKHDMKWAKKLGFDGLIVDEATMYKHPNNRRSKALKPLLPLFKRRWGLTAKPAPNGLMDLFGQVYIADQGRTFGKFITGFRRKYFDSKGYGGYTYELREGAEKQIYKDIKPLVMRLDDPAYLAELPKLIDDPIYIELPEKARKLYKETEKEFFAKFDDKIILAANAAVASGKCRQIASGGVLHLMEDGKRAPISERWTKIHDEKMDALVEIVDSLQGRPLLVAYEFKHELERFKKEFGKDLPFIGGGVTFKRAKEIEAEWNKGRIPILAGQPSSMSHGLNMQESANHIAWFTLPWKLDDYEQLIGRILRQGNPNKRVFNHLIIARGTIEEAVLESLGLKGTTQERLLAALSKYRRTMKAA